MKSKATQPDQKLKLPAQIIGGSRLLSSLISLHQIVPWRINPASRDVFQGEVLSKQRTSPKTRISPVLWSLIGLVLVPSAVITLYLFCVASNQYSAESRFVVQHVEHQAPAKEKLSSLTSALDSSGSMATETQDAEIVASYINSDAILPEISREIDLRQIYRRPEADFWARLKENASAEDLRDYWMSMVSTYVDYLSGIVTVRVRAFRRDDALAISKSILSASERLINELSARARTDAMTRAEDEVRRSEGLVRSALTDLAHYRDQENFIDPVKTAEQTGKLLTELTAQSIQFDTDLFIAKETNSMGAPGINTLKAKIASTKAQIKELKSKLTGNDPAIHNVAASLVRFEELELKRTFAETMYKFARDGLDRARISAERQTVYLSVFVDPALPQDYSYPPRFTYSLLSAIGLLMIWSIGIMTLASIQDHRL